MTEFTDNEYTESYTYDNVGNMLTKSINDDIINYNYNNANQLIEEIKDNQSVTYKYNENGDLVSKSTGETYKYDIQGNLTSITGNGIDKEYTYNGNGNRLSESTDGETTYFVNDVNRAYEQVLQTYNDDGVIDTYTYGLQRINSVGEDNETYLYDGRGSVVGSVNENNEFVSYSYTAYGDLMPSSPTPNTFGFNAEATDYSTGLQYLRARYYDTNINRFIEEDIHIGNTRIPISMNRYVYVQNNPVMGIDPSGYMLARGSGAGGVKTVPEPVYGSYGWSSQYAVSNTNPVKSVYNNGNQDKSLPIPFKDSGNSERSGAGGQVGGGGGGGGGDNTPSNSYGTSTGGGEYICENDGGELTLQQEIFLNSLMSETSIQFAMANSYDYAHYTDTVEEFIETNRKMLSMSTATTPVVDDIRDLQEAVFGVDLITGEKLEPWQRWLAGGAFAVSALLAAFSGGFSEYLPVSSIDEILTAPKIADDLVENAGVIDDAVKLIGDTANITEDVLNSANDIVKISNDIFMNVNEIGHIVNSVEDGFQIAGYGSTGRTIANDLAEQLAMQQVKSNPLQGAVELPIPMTDSRWPLADGWVKMQNVVTLSNGTKVNIHFVYNKITGAFDDFKFK